MLDNIVTLRGSSPDSGTAQSFLDVKQLLGAQPCTHGPYKNPDPIIFSEMRFMSGTQLERSVPNSTAKAQGRSLIIFPELRSLDYFFEATPMSLRYTSYTVSKLDDLL